MIRARGLDVSGVFSGAQRKTHGVLVLGAALCCGAGTGAFAANIESDPLDRGHSSYVVAATHHDTPTVDERIKALGIEPIGIVASLAAYRADHVEGGDVLAAKVSDPLARTTLEWVALHKIPRESGFDRMKAFSAAHPAWPAANWIRRQMEAGLLHTRTPIEVELFFTDRAPETVPGKLALAKALKVSGRAADGTKLARAVFRESDLPVYLEAWLTTEFGSDLTRADYKYRADRLLYQEHPAPALRYAALAGPDVLALAKARVAVITQTASDKAIDAVPETWRKDPGLLLVQEQKLRRQGKLIEAARIMQTAPRDQAQLIDTGDWWTERRVLARELLDAGKVNAAYITCALHAPGSREDDVDAEFHAGWIALRFMHDAERATYHFWVASKLTATPTSIARIAYWQARTADVSRDAGIRASAKNFYEKAAAYPSTYYGQLARASLGLETENAVSNARAATGTDRDEAIRAIELLYATGERDAASSLAADVAGELTDGEQIGALAALIASQGDAHLALTIGKILGQRGIFVEPLAYPAFGIPPYTALANSAPAPIVYSVARQESAFARDAVSRAGAKGLMQMIAATAKRTAKKAGLPFNVDRLLHDPSFNAQLGAAHLGTLIADHDGSLILTFAAYNAGEGRVHEWIEAYGDPRKPGVDPVDWVERIPFTETRDYVQKVVANVAVYTAIFAEKAKASAAAQAAREAKL